MLGLDYKDLYHRIEQHMRNSDISIDMKRALLDFEMGLRKVECQELTEQISDMLHK